jgi:urea ABC transporter ATP-binding protein UrtE
VILKIEDLHASYGGSLVLQGVNLSIQKGEIKALMGRNGMGKTTLLKTIMGLLTSQTGNILFDGRPIQGCQTHEIASSGISYVPQGREIFGEFSVWENLRLGTLRNPRSMRKIPRDIFEYFPILYERRNQRAGSFSGGEQQMLAIARALVGQPKLLLLDEPSEGIQPSIVDQICEILKKINVETGLTILIVEQNVDMIMGLAAVCSFMEKGQIVQTCSIDDIRLDESIITCHMGV